MKAESCSCREERSLFKGVTDEGGLKVRIVVGGFTARVLKLFCVKMPDA